MTVTSLGIDIGGTHIRAISETAGVRSEVSHDAVSRNLSGLIAQIVALVAHHRPATTAVTLPGRVFENRPVWIPNLSFLDGVDLVEAITAEVDTDIVLLNDAQASLIAERHEGAAKGAANVALVAIGTGIGGAVALNGELYLGHTGTAGSFGWLGADPADASDALAPGSSGPWERAAAGTALLDLVQPFSTIEEFLDALEDENPVAVTASQEFSRRLSGGFAAIASVFDPEKIIVVGGVSSVVDKLREDLSRRMQTLASPTGRKVDVVVGTLGSRAGTVGALLRAQGVKG